MPVMIVTDSTAALPPDLAEQHGIEVVPLLVRFGETEYRDGVDLSDAEFYCLLEDRPELPVTSQPSPAAFMEVYRRLGCDGDAIVSIHVSSAVSGTLASAQQAAAELPGQDIRVLDSRHVSIGLGMMAVEAARAASRGDDANAVVDLVTGLVERTYTVFVVATLEYLRRSGRIGGAQAFLGSLLSVKPVLEARDGKVGPVLRVRTFSKAYAALADYVRQHAPHGLERAALLHADAEPHRRWLEEQLLAGLPPEVEVHSDISIGPVVASHTGRGAFGIAFVARP